MKKITKNKTGFVLIELLITMALISIFLIYFIPSIMQALKNIEIKKETRKLDAIANEYIEKSIANGKLFDSIIIDDEKFSIDINVISENKKQSLSDVKLTVTSNKSKRFKEYVFTIKTKN